MKLRTIAFNLALSAAASAVSYADAVAVHGRMFLDAWFIGASIAMGVMAAISGVIAVGGIAMRLQAQD